MNTTEAINYFDLISTMSQQNAYRASWYIVAIVLVLSFIFATIHYCIDKFTHTDEESTINYLVRKQPIKYMIIAIGIFLTIIYFGQQSVQKFLYNTKSFVKKDDVIRSEYFKNLDEHKKELMRLYLLCDNSTEVLNSQKADCDPLTINTNEFSSSILTNKLNTIISKLETTDSTEISKNVAEANETRALIERIKTAK